MKTLLSLLVLLAALPVLGQTVYRWVDAQGVVHYSDQPHKGAQPVQLGSKTTVLDFKTPQQPAAAATAPPASTLPTAAYQLKILAPAPGTTLWPVNYKVKVNVEVKPPLSGGALLQYQLDGKVIGQPTAKTAFEIHKVYRGTHTLTVSILGPKGRISKQANSTFYVHQHSVLHPGRSRRSGGGGGSGGGGH